MEEAVQAEAQRLGIHQPQQAKTTIQLFEPRTVLSKVRNLESLRVRGEGAVILAYKDLGRSARVQQKKTESTNRACDVEKYNSLY